MLLARGNDEIFGLRLLQDEPLRAHIVARMPPIPKRVEVAQIQALVEPLVNAGEAAGDLAGDERFPPDCGLVVEKDSIAGIQAVGLAIVDRYPVRVGLGRTIGGARIERRRFTLRRFLRLAVHFRSRSLVKARLLTEIQYADRF